MQKGSARLLVAMAVVPVVVAGLLVVLSQLGGGGSQESFTGIPQDETREGGRAGDHPTLRGPPVPGVRPVRTRNAPGGPKRSRGWIWGGGSGSERKATTRSWPPSSRGTVR